VYARRTAGNADALRELNDSISLLTTAVLQPFAVQPDIVSEALRARVDTLLE